MNLKIIATDFDGTLCEDKWPEIGAPNNEIIIYLKEQKAAGAKVIFCGPAVLETSLQRLIGGVTAMDYGLMPSMKMFLK